MAAKTETLTGSDAEHGYRFGVKGVMTAVEAATFCGCSRRTISRLVDRGKLRASAGTKHTLICRESITRYMESIRG